MAIYIRFQVSDFSNSLFVALFVGEGLCVPCGYGPPETVRRGTMSPGGASPSPTRRNVGFFSVGDEQSLDRRTLPARRYVLDVPKTYDTVPCPREGRAPPLHAEIRVYLRRGGPWPSRNRPVRYQVRGLKTEI